MAIQHRMHHASCRGWNVREMTDQALSNLWSSPARPLLLDLDDLLFNLKWQLVCKAHGPATTVRQGLETAFPLAGNDFMTRDPGNSKLATQIGNALPIQISCYKLKLLIHLRTFAPQHSRSLLCPETVKYVSGITCKLCIGKHISKASAHVLGLLCLE